MKNAPVYRILQIGLGLGAAVIVCAVWFHTVCSKSHIGFCWSIRELDFVLNRYQTLITGVFAAITIFYLHKQIEQEFTARQDIVKGKLLAYELQVKDELFDPFDNAVRDILNRETSASDYEKARNRLMDRSLPSCVRNYELLSLIGRKNARTLQVFEVLLDDIFGLALKLANTLDDAKILKFADDYWELREKHSLFFSKLSHHGD